MKIPVWVPWGLCSLLSAGLGAGAMYMNVAAVEQVIPTLIGAAGKAPARRLDLPQLEPLVGLADATERSSLLASDESFAAFVEVEARNQSVLISAYAQAADRNDSVQTLMKRAAQRVLVESYLNEILRAKLPAETPTDAAARAFYADHPDQFLIPERVHLWQIFLPATSGTERQNAKALGRQLMETLVSGKATFGELALLHSGHPQSRFNGGYMGLIPRAELKPEVRTAIEGIPVGKFVGPVESAEGYHLLQRGSVVEGAKLDFAEAEPQVREYLRRQTAAEIRTRAVQEMVETYPVDFDRGKVSEWRAKLLQLNQAGPQTVPP